MLGANGEGLAERRKIARTLKRKGIIVLVPEDDFPRDVSPSVAEPATLADGDVDLVFLNLQSWGTAGEFGQFHENQRIAPKLRVLVPLEYHPFHGKEKGYLTDLYLAHLARFGHVYGVASKDMATFRSAKTIITKLAERYRQIVAMDNGSTK